MPGLRDLSYQSIIKGMWYNNTGDSTIEGGSNRSFKILNGPKNIGPNQA